MIYTERIINHRYMIYILTKSTSWRSCVYNLQHHSYNSIIVKLESRPLISLILYHGWILNMKEFRFLVKNIKGIEKIWNRTSHALQLPFNSCTNQQACLPVHTYIHDQILHSATDDDTDTRSASHLLDKTNYLKKGHPLKAYPLQIQDIFQSVSLR